MGKPIVRIAIFIAGGLAIFTTSVALNWGFIIFCGLSFVWAILLPAIAGPLPKEEVDYLYYTMGIAGLALFYAYGSVATQHLAEQRELLASTQRMVVLRGLRDNPDAVMQQRDLQERLLLQVKERQSGALTGNSAAGALYIFQITGGDPIEHARLPPAAVESYYSDTTSTADRQRALIAIRSASIDALKVEEAWNAKKTLDVQRLTLERDGSLSRFRLAAFWPYLLALALALKLARSRLIL